MIKARAAVVPTYRCAVARWPRNPAVAVRERHYAEHRVYQRMTPPGVFPTLPRWGVFLYDAMPARLPTSAWAGPAAVAKALAGAGSRVNVNAHTDSKESPRTAAPPRMQ